MGKTDRTETEIAEIAESKKTYLELLLLGDEQEDMIDRYLERGTMYVLRRRPREGLTARPEGASAAHANGNPAAQALAVCVVTDEGDGVLEIKNLAVRPECQRQGYARKLVEFVADTYRGRFRTLQAGTGDSPLTLPFYEACGFVRSRVIKDFFTENYDHPIWEGGVLLRDMVYLKRDL